MAICRNTPHGASFKDHINENSNEVHGNMKVEGTDCAIFCGRNFYVKEIFYGGIFIDSAALRIPARNRPNDIPLQVKNSVKFIMSEYGGARFIHNWMFLIRMSFNSSAKKDRLERWNIGSLTFLS